ncbi:DUF2934 domain-containing protein [Nitrospira sp. KM1]|uniref:DUF2934 domain-containing protein n=1 Tax=Nitrospira sp. KM1 TaxID=1936990 RepID=UPI0015636CAE|nr:DUF2934 domain-containing protein [Nitrospira sp. KM1]
MAQWFAQWYFGTYRPFYLWATTSAPFMAPGNDTDADSNRRVEVFREQIANRAYDIYQQRIHQGALDDWLQAEGELLGQ